MWRKCLTSNIYNYEHNYSANIILIKVTINPLTVLVHGRSRSCVSVCVCRPLQLLKDESSASKSFYRLLVMFTWILICGFAK